MYFYVLFAILIAKAVEPYSSCDRSKLNSAQNTFNSLSNQIIDLDKKVQDTCKQFTSFTAKEVFAYHAFQLQITLPSDFAYASFEVKVKHRVVYINGHYPKQGKECDLTYVDIKVLPDFVNTHGGAWTYKDGKLFVAFPYAYNIRNHSADCSSRYIDETLISLRRGSPSEDMFSDD